MQQTAFLVAKGDIWGFYLLPDKRYSNLMGTMFLKLFLVCIKGLLDHLKLFCFSAVFPESQ